MVRILEIRKTRVDLKDVHKIFGDRPYLFWFIVISIAFTNFVVSYFINLYYYTSPLVVSGIGASPFFIGISTSVFMLGTIAFSSISGILFHRVSIRNLIILAIVLSTVFSVLTAFASSIPELLAFRFLMALGNGIIQGAVTAVLGGMYRERRVFLLSLKGVTYSSGVLVGPYTESVFAPLYRPAFMYSALAGIISLIILLFFIPDIRMNMVEKTKSGISKLFNWNTTLTFLAIFFFGIGFFGFISYYSHFLLYYLHLGNIQSATVVSSLGIGGIFLTIPFALSSNYLGRKNVLVIIFLLLCVTSFSIFYFHLNYLVLVLISLIFGGAYNGLINLIAAAAQEWAHDDALGTASGATFSFYYGGGVIGGALFAYVREVIGFPETGLIAVTAFMVLALGCSILLKDIRNNYNET